MLHMKSFKFNQDDSHTSSIVTLDFAGNFSFFGDYFLEC